MLNARIRKRWRAGRYPVGLIGDHAALTYSYDYLGAGVETLSDVASSRHAFAETLKKAERPLILVGQRLQGLGGGQRDLDSDVDVAFAMMLRAEHYTLGLTSCRSTIGYSSELRTEAADDAATSQWGRRGGGGLSESGHGGDAGAPPGRAGGRTIARPAQAEGSPTVFSPRPG